MKDYVLLSFVSINFYFYIIVILEIKKIFYIYISYLR